MLDAVKALGRLLAGIGLAGMLLALFLDPLLMVIGFWLGLAGLVLWAAIALWQWTRAGPPGTY